jgi:hypothetical protein
MMEQDITSDFDFDFDFDYFENNLKKISYNSRSDIEQFYFKRITENPILGNYIDYINYLDCELRNNHKYFYKIIDYKKDKILITVTKMRIGPAQYNRLFEFPISINNNIKNEQILFDLLFNSNYISQSFVSNFDIEKIDKNKYIIEKEISDNNFYNYIPDSIKIKYVSDTRLNLVKNNNNFIFREVNQSDKNLIYELWENWSSTKDFLGNKTQFNGYFSNFNMLLFAEQMLQYVLIYKDKAIAFVCFIPTMDKTYCYKPMQFALRKEGFENDKDLYLVLGQIGGILQRLFLEKLNQIGYKYVCCAGASKSGLLASKHHLATDSIKYYKVIKKE